MTTNSIKTVKELIEYLKLFPDDSDVFYDTNPLTGGAFEYLIPHPTQESPLEHPRSVAFISTKGW